MSIPYTTDTFLVLDINRLCQHHRDDTDLDHHLDLYDHLAYLWTYRPQPNDHRLRKDEDGRLQSQLWWLFAPSREYRGAWTSKSP